MFDPERKFLSPDVAFQISMRYDEAILVVRRGGYMFEVIPESEEVVEQRVRDLSAFVEANLPQIFAKAQEPGTKELKVGMSKSSFMEVLEMLDEEFGGWQRMGLISFLSAHVSDLMAEPIMEIVSEDEHDEDDPNTYYLDVLWNETFPSFEGDLGKLSALSATVARQFLDQYVWDAPAAGENALQQMELLGDSVKFFNGMLGFNLLCAYIRIVRHSDLPRISVRTITENLE